MSKDLQVTFRTPFSARLIALFGWLSVLVGILLFALGVTTMEGRGVAAIAAISLMPVAVSTFLSGVVLLGVARIVVSTALSAYYAREMSETLAGLRLDGRLSLNRS